MTTTTSAPRATPVQQATQLTMQVIMGGDVDGDAIAKIHQHMQDYAMTELRKAGWASVFGSEKGDDAFVLTPEFVLAEERENDDVALAYWAETSAFFRKVFQACAAQA